jgi:hypothetical protein
MPAPGAAGLSASSSIVRGQNRLPPYRAVQIEKGLRAESPENGNIPQVGWRPSAISREGCHFSGRGDAAQNARKPVFSGLFVIWLRTILS